MNEPMRALANAITEKFILAAPQEAAKALESLATHEILLLTAPLKAQVLVMCFNVMTPQKAAAVIRRLPLKQAAYLLTHLELTQAARLMVEFSGPYQERLKAALPDSFLQLLQEANSYVPGSAGSLMQTDFISLKTEAKVAQLVERLKSLPKTKLPAVCFVTAKDGTLKGFIRTAELAFFQPQSVCGSIMTPCKGVTPQTAGDALAQFFKEEQTDYLPVVTEKNVLVGVVARWALLTVETEKPFWKKWTH